MKITVTREDIQNAQRRDPEQCAVARALVRAGLDHCGVMGPSVMVPDRWGRLISLPLPAAVSDWIFDFDAGKRVRPISFDLDFGPKREPKRLKVSKNSKNQDEKPLGLLSEEELNSVSRLHCGSLCKRPVLTHSTSSRSSKGHSRKRIDFCLV